MLHVQHDWPLCQGLSTLWGFLHMAQGAFKLQSERSRKPGTHPEKPNTTEVTVHVATMHCASSLFNDRLTVHWVGPETLVGLVVEGQEINAFADSGSQVNTVTPSFVHQHESPILPLGDLVDHLLNLIGLGGMKTRPMGFVILWVQVSKIAGYDEDVVSSLSQMSQVSSSCDRDVYAWEDHQCHQRGWAGRTVHLPGWCLIEAHLP